MIRGQAGRDKDIFELPEMPPQDEDIIISSEDSDSETDLILEKVGLKNVHDVYQVDVESQEFVNLPKNVQYEVLNDLKGKKKQNSWAKMHEMPRKAEDFSGFQLERLKRRRKIEAKLDNVKEDLSKNQMELMDSKLFVGDKIGLKKLKAETRRMASRSDAGVVFMSGLSQTAAVTACMTAGDEGPGTSAGHEPRTKMARREAIKDDEDEEDINEAIALSLTAGVGPSQDDIYSMIKNETTDTSMDCDSDTDSDIIVLIPPPSEFQSNRAGGLGLEVRIKEEVQEVTIKEEVQEDTGCDEGVGEACVMSDSDSESSDGEFVDVDGEEKTNDREEDIFADVFYEKENISKLESIVLGAKSEKDKPIVVNNFSKINPDATELLERITQLDKPSDIFADIAARAKSKPSISISSVKNKPHPDIPVLEPLEEHLEVSKSNFSREVSDSLKNGPGIMMKIASKWAEDQAKHVESDDSDVDNPATYDNEPEKDVFDVEQEKLVKEMNEAHRESRLLKLTQSGTDLNVVTKSKEISKTVEAKSSSIATVRTDAKLKSTTSSLLEAGGSRESSASDGKIYMAPAAGFVPGGRGVDQDKIVQLLDDEAAEFDPGEVAPQAPEEAGLQTQDLLELQEKLAAEQNSLVAEMGKANRLSDSITDQMYADCQDLLQLFGLPWVVAPGEAEAQCAFLDSEGLTQGTITDDSDIWLFGGSRVYKNFFDQDKYVEFFNGTEIVAHFGLNRDKLGNY